MWSDNETTDDLFGFRVHADLVRELILDPTVLPATIGVFGDWGGGKSSIMQMLRYDFEDESGGKDPETKACEGVAVLYFNGWLFEGYDDAKAALLSSILTALRDHKRFGPKLKARASSLLKRVDYMRGLRMLFAGAAAGAVAAATGGVGLAALIPAFASGAAAGARDSAPDALKESVGKAGETSPDEALSDIRQFRDDFAKMLAESDIKTLVVLIDDLDRCSPERIIENLEAIKLFLNVPNTAFVIGADRRVIRQAVAWRYRDAINVSAVPGGEQDDPTDRLVDDYLEKLIQIPYRLPRLSPSEIETYLTLLFCQRHLEPAPYRAVCDGARKCRAEDRYSAFGQMHVLEILKGTEIPPELAQALRIGAGIARQITDVLRGNPRQVKRFLNAFFLRRKLAQVAKLDEVKDEFLVKLMLLEYAEPRLFEKLFAGMDGSTGAVAMLADLEPRIEGAKTATRPPSMETPTEWQSMNRWLAMPPSLADVDLRDYMWVTRDRLGSTMTGTILVPTIVRSVLKQVLSEMGQKAGFLAIRTMTPQERGILAQQLVLQAQRTPNELRPFRALTEIAEIETDVAAQFKALVGRIPKGDISPAVAIDIVNLAKKKTALGKVCGEIVSEFAEEKTAFGKALKQKPR